MGGDVETEHRSRIEREENQMLTYRVTYALVGIAMLAGSLESGSAARLELADGGTRPKPLRLVLLA